MNVHTKSTFVTQIRKSVYTYVMADNKERLHMRVDSDFKDRLEGLKKKHGIDASSVVKMAVAQMAERDLSPTVKVSKRSEK